MPEEKVEVYQVGWKVFFRTRRYEAEPGIHLRSAVAPNSSRCWHPECEQLLTGSRGVCKQAEGLRWDSYDYSPGVFSFVRHEVAPFAIFTTEEDALAWMLQFKHRPLELWTVSYLPAEAPLLCERVRIPKGTSWARAVRPDARIASLRELEAHEKLQSEEA